MLLTSSLNEHACPAAYLTPDAVSLVDQVEADVGLRLSTSRDPHGTGSAYSGYESASIRVAAAGY